jgi:hypothetical protein
MSDYIVAGRRKSKCDKRAKGRYKLYKKGGKYRSVKFKDKEQK